MSSGNPCPLRSRLPTARSGHWSRRAVSAAPRLVGGSAAPVLVVMPYRKERAYSAGSVGRPEHAVRGVSQNEEAKSNQTIRKPRRVDGTASAVSKTPSLSVELA